MRLQGLGGSLPGPAHRALVGLNVHRAEGCQVRERGDNIHFVPAKTRAHRENPSAPRLVAFELQAVHVLLQLGDVDPGLGKLREPGLVHLLPVKSACLLSTYVIHGDTSERSYSPYVPQEA